MLSNGKAAKEVGVDVVEEAGAGGGAEARGVIVVDQGRAEDSYLVAVHLVERSKLERSMFLYLLAAATNNMSLCMQVESLGRRAMHCVRGIFDHK